jgi:hypothetical protein
MRISFLSTPIPARTRIFVVAVGIFALLAIAGFLSQPAMAGVGITVPGTVPPGGTIPLPLLSTVLVIHSAPFAIAPADTALDICTEDDLPLAGLSNLIYLDQASTILVSGEYDWKAAEAGTNCANTVIDLAPFRVDSGAEYLLLLTGDGANQPLDSLFVTLTAGTPDMYLPIIFR